MTAIRRVVILTGLTVAVVISASVPASATFADAAAVSHTVSTGTVAAPAGVTVNDYCIATTTRSSTTTYVNPGTGYTAVTASSTTTTTAASSSNLQSSTTTTTAGPGPNETTTVTTTVNTTLYVTVNWPASTTQRGVTGYLVNAHLNNASVYAMAQTAGLTTSADVDADYLYYQPRLSVTTLTSYGWTATTALTAVLSC
jgi:hypothetical protein